MIKKRVLFLDVAKAIGIFLVVLGHANPPSGVVKLIYAFHMPLFFFISGYLFNFTKYPTTGGFIKTKAKHLLIPYLSLNIISYLFWLFVSRNYGIDNAADVPVYKPLIGMIYGNGINDFLHHCVPLWFLVCLFVVEVLFYLLFKNVKQKLLLLLGFAIIGYLDHYFSVVRLPWGINIAFTAIVFYGIGHVCKQQLDKLLEAKTWLLGLSATTLIGIMGLIALRNGVPDMNSRIYNNYTLFIIGAFSGTVALLIISKLIEDRFNRLSAFVFLSMNTLVILGFHKIIGELIKGGLWFAFDINPARFVAALPYDVALAIAEILVLVPFILFINAYIPVILGKEDFNAFFGRFRKKVARA